MSSSEIQHLRSSVESLKGKELWVVTASQLSNALLACFTSWNFKPVRYHNAVLRIANTDNQCIIVFEKEPSPENCTSLVELLLEYQPNAVKILHIHINTNNMSYKTGIRTVTGDLFSHYTNEDNIHLTGIAGAFLYRKVCSDNSINNWCMKAIVTNDWGSKWSLETISNIETATKEIFNGPSFEMKRSLFSVVPACSASTSIYS